MVIVVRMGDRLGWDDDLVDFDGMNILYSLIIKHYLYWCSQQTLYLITIINQTIFYKDDDT